MGAPVTVTRLAAPPGSRVMRASSTSTPSVKVKSGVVSGAVAILVRKMSPPRVSKVR